MTRRLLILIATVLSLEAASLLTFLPDFRVYGRPESARYQPRRCVLPKCGHERVSERLRILSLAQY